MAKRILVPLDRSEHAEAVLPIVADIARSSGATVRLVNVARAPEQKFGDYGRVVAYESQEVERVTYSRLDYLRGAQAQLDGVPVEPVVRFGDVAEEIAREAEAFGADLVALTEPRRGWFGRLFGSMATALRRKTTVPLLVLADR
ncbi:MAG TPA: universal stress protein [Methylomirabilota bacterium]|nr:universal stress protein [Methylomirabilota bacterium]